MEGGNKRDNDLFGTRVSNSNEKHSVVYDVPWGLDGCTGIHVTGDASVMSNIHANDRCIAVGA